MTIFKNICYSNFQKISFVDYTNMIVLDKTSNKVMQTFSVKINWIIPFTLQIKQY